jgi:hypothetical protein
MQIFVQSPFAPSSGQKKNCGKIKNLFAKKWGGVDVNLGHSN